MTIRDMVARHSDYAETQDFIPTPPWATRVLYEYVAPDLKELAPSLTAWDPARGQNHMLKVFDEYNHAKILGSDVVDHPDAVQPTDGRPWTTWTEDFTHDDIDTPPNTAGVIITNPPYKHLERFIDNALHRADYGVGMLCRIQALETESRYNSVFSCRPPTQLAFFSNRIPFKTGTVVKKAPKMFFHVWLWWERYIDGSPIAPRPPMWIPYDAQARLEKDTDYE